MKLIALVFGIGFRLLVLVWFAVLGFISLELDLLRGFDVLVWFTLTFRLGFMLSGLSFCWCSRWELFVDLFGLCFDLCF